MPGDKFYTAALTLKDIVRLFDVLWHVCDETGKVTNLRTNKILKPYTGNNEGHLFVRLYQTPLRKTIAVHRLVWMYQTRQTIPPNFEIHHVDGDTKNNSWDNLMCVHKLDHRKLHKAEEVPF